MTLEEFREFMAGQPYVEAGSDVHEFFHAYADEARKSPPNSTADTTRQKKSSSCFPA